jgi:glycosidase
MIPKPLRFSGFWCGLGLLALWWGVALPPVLAEQPVNEPFALCADQTAVGQPDWVRSAVIYEVNVRQYSDESSFAAVEDDLDRIADLGVTTLWFMPVHPIGEINRKGTLGSYYSISDYRGINPEFGTAADFKRLVEAAHGRGLRVIMDWVANHTAWDHPWTESHPQYFATNEAGEFVPPYGFDWTDVIQLDYTEPTLWDAMFGDMVYWLNNYNLFGFRCDYSMGLPTAFWDEAARQLREVSPDIYLLSEAETPQHQLQAFNTSYGFDMMHAINSVAAGDDGASHIDDDLARTAVRFPAGSSMLYYTTNHDENTWQGTVFERLGGGVEVFAVLSYLLDGVPLIYNGQEAGLAKRVEFFEHDPIDWRPHPMAGLYRTLNGLRRDNPAIHTGATFRRVATTQNDAVYLVHRQAGEHQILGLLNLTGHEVEFGAVDAVLAGEWQDVFTGETVTLEPTLQSRLPAWGYRVLQHTE